MKGAAHEFRIQLKWESYFVTFILRDVINIYTLHNTEGDETLRENEWAKFKGAFSSVDDILHHFKQYIRKFEYDLISISIVSSSTTDNLNELDSSIYLRGQYANNSIDLRSVN